MQKSVLYNTLVSVMYKIVMGVSFGLRLDIKQVRIRKVTYHKARNC